MRFLVSLAAVLTFLTISVSAAAYGDGAPGYTGKQGSSCTGCHGGNAAKPTVTINGPASLAAGATGDFTMVVTTNLGRGAGGIAATDGVTLTPGTGLQEGNGELSHTGARATTAGAATFTFKVTAPATGTTLKLYAVGMGSNGTGTGGDGTTQITKDIAITGGAATPTTPTTPATPTTPTTPAGDAAETVPAGTTTDTAATEPAKSSKKKNKKTVEDDAEEDEEEGDDVGGPRRRFDPYAGGCSSTSRAPLDVSFAGIGILVVLGLVIRRRAR